MPEKLLIAAWKQGTFHCYINFSTAAVLAFRGIKLQTHFPYLAAVSELLLSGATASEQSHSTAHVALAWEIIPACLSVPWNSRSCQGRLLLLGVISRVVQE